MALLLNGYLPDNLLLVKSFAAGGARIVELHLPLWEPSHDAWDRYRLPAELAGLSHLTKLLVANDAIEDGWQHLPLQLKQLDLSHCRLWEVPAELAGLKQLEQLHLSNNYINSGWQHLPQQLQQLRLDDCGLVQVPAELADLQQLTELSLSENPIEGGWKQPLRQLT